MIAGDNDAPIEGWEFPGADHSERGPENPAIEDFGSEPSLPSTLLPETSPARLLDPERLSQKSFDPAAALEPQFRSSDREAVASVPEASVSGRVFEPERQMLDREAESLLSSTPESGTHESATPDPHTPDLPGELPIDPPCGASEPPLGLGLTRHVPESGNGSFAAVPGANVDETPLFAHYGRRPAPVRQSIPNFGDLLIFLLLVVAGYLCSGLVVLGAMHFHLFGVSTLKQATTEIHYTLGSQVAWYLVTLGLCVAVFPLIWHESWLQGLEWRPEAAIRLRVRLFAAAMVCFVLAVVDGILIPGPTDTPIDQIFRIPGAAWLLFGFGVTLAPLFEEVAYRGFLLPTLCTAYDWLADRMKGTPPRALDSKPTHVADSSADSGLDADALLNSYAGPQPARRARLRFDAAAGASPRWSYPAMIVGSFLTSIPFALMHGEQTGYSVGPFVLLMCVSMVLCAVRLTARSLASSVLVHSCYNLLLFSLMLAGTGGFRHLERM